MNNVGNPLDKSSPEYQKNLLKTARYNLLVAIVFTVLNIVMLLTGSNRYFLFSATIPYYLTYFGYAFDFYTVSTYTLTGLAMAAVPVVGYVVFWLLSRKNDRWLMGALVLFGLDTLAMGLMILWTGEIASVILEIVFHVWVMIVLIRGVIASRRLRELPVAQEEVTYTFDTPAEEPELTAQD